MAQVVYSRRALADLDRFFEFLVDDPLAARKALTGIIEAVTILERHPLIGRLAEAGLRELVISYGPTSYVALYRHVADRDTVLLLALRHQKEAGYPQE